MLSLKGAQNSMFVEADYQDSKPNKFDMQTFRGVSILQPDVSEIKPSERF